MVPAFWHFHSCRVQPPPSLCRAGLGDQEHISEMIRVWNLRLDHNIQHLTHPGGNQMACHKGIKQPYGKAHMARNWDLLSTSMHMSHVVDSLAPIRSSDNCNPCQLSVCSLMRNPEPEPPDEISPNSCPTETMWDMDVHCETYILFLGHKESWVPKNWCFRIVVLEKTLESPLDSKEIKLKGNQLWIFIGRTDVEAEAPIPCPPDVKNWLTGRDPDAGKDWRGTEKRAAEDEMAG